MNKRVFKISLLILGLLVLSCSRAAPQGPLPISSAVACTSNSDCTTNNEICDTIFNNGTDTGSGSCRQICNPNSTKACPPGDSCNPINGVCETACGSQSTNFCPTRFATKLGTGYSPTCIAGNYCAVQPNGTNCPPDFKPSGGFCKPVASNCSKMQGLTPDLITGTCEVSCTANKDCNVLNYTTAAPSSTAVTFSCSPVTSTCVPSCTYTQVTTAGGKLPTSGCSGSFRDACYLAGNPASGTGTCEQGCSGTCGTNLSCAEGICQSQCTLDTDCTTNGSKTRCDLISQVCRVPCSQIEDSACNAIANFGCSAFSATCAPNSSNTVCVDTLRNSAMTSDRLICEILTSSSCPHTLVPGSKVQNACGIGGSPCPYSMTRTNDGICHL